MLNRDRILALLLVLLLGGFGFGIWRLFELRFAAGDIYPAGSSFRADPLGTKALFRGLERLGFNVRRHLQPTGGLDDGRDTALLVLGTDPQALNSVDQTEAETLERFVKSGGRLVLALESTPPPLWPPEVGTTAPAPEKKSGDEEDRPKPRAKRRSAEEPTGRAPFDRRVSLGDRWGFKLERGARESPAAGLVASRDVAGPGGLPKDLPWHSTASFSNVQTNWSSVYRRGDQPVVLERRLGLGSIVLSADSYLFSNEALRFERQPALLAWMLGPARRVWFDETHLGISEQPGVAALARTYRLHGLLAGLLLLAGLFLWQSAARFAPMTGGDWAGLASELVKGRDTGVGFTNLLRRGVPPAEVLSVCFAEWKRSFAGHRQTGRECTERLTEVLAKTLARPERERDPVATYREMAAVVARRRGSGPGPDTGFPHAN